MDAMTRHAMRQFADAAVLARALAADVADTLERAIQARGNATLAVSGGSTPKRFLAELSKEEIDWSRVTVTLVDERWTDEESERSNARLVRSLLLQNNAAQAVFVPLWRRADMPEDAIGAVRASVAAIGLPFDAVVLGMGADGHTASFFPNGDGLDAATDPHTRMRIEIVRSDAAGEPRVTLTLPFILSAGFLALHIEGAEKRRVFEQACQPGEADDMPIRHVLGARDDVTVYWAP